MSRAFIVRPAVLEDFEAWRETYHQVAVEGRWIGGESARPVEVMLPRFQSSIDSENELMLVAEAGDPLRVVGGLFAEFSRPGVAHIGMQLLDEWRSAGIGSALMESCIRWCREQDAHKIALEVWPHNERAIGLYEKCGFVTEGRLTRHYRRRNGELWDALVMGLVLDETSPGNPHYESG